MASLKVQFLELKKNIPPHVQWLVLAATFVVVLILLILLLRTDKQPTISENIEPAVLSVDPMELDWTATYVGEIQKQTFAVSVNAPVKIDDVRVSKEITGLSNPKTTCTNAGPINSDLPCTISLEYAPTDAMEITALSLFIDWRDAQQPADMNRTEKITIALGAAVKEEPKPAPIPEDTIRSEIEAIAPPTNSFIFDEPAEPEYEPYVPEPETLFISDEPVESYQSANACSEFAFPGYNSAGQQIGWIKPDRGGYRYHPFSDVGCVNPTGVYNPDNGIITDIKDPSKKLGTDAEHIGYTTIQNGVIPQLSNPVEARPVIRAKQLTSEQLSSAVYTGALQVFEKSEPTSSMLPSSFNGGQATVSSQPYDRTFVLRQYKPIPATIVSEIRAARNETRLPVTATVDRNVYSDDGRTIVVPAGTMMLGSVTGDMPGPYKAIGRIHIDWYRFIRPDGVEFNFGGDKPFSADAQGRTGVPGHGSTDYMEQFVMPMLTAMVPAAVNMIAPMSDKFVNQIDLNNNLVTQSGLLRSSELAKNEIITSWNRVAQKLMVDMIDNTVPPFSIAAGTRITVFSPNDLIITCGAKTGSDSDKKCAITEFDNGYARTIPGIPENITIGQGDPDSLVGQVRSFDLSNFCDGNGGVRKGAEQDIQKKNMDYRTVLFYCQSNQYQAINNARQEAVYQNQLDTTFNQSITNSDGSVTQQKIQKGSADYNTQVLGLNYNNDGTIENPFAPPPVVSGPATITCEDGTTPDGNGCCTGETFTDMGDQGFNCCPAGGGDCFPPII